MATQYQFCLDGQKIRGEDALEEGLVDFRDRGFFPQENLFSRVYIRKNDGRLFARTSRGKNLLECELILA